MGDNMSAPVWTGIETTRAGTPDLSDTALFLSGVFELHDEESRQTKAKRPFGSKEFFAGLVQLSLRLDLAQVNASYVSGLCFPGENPARPSCTFHAVFRFSRSVLEFLQKKFFP
jgi:hypothetical protein